jgi:hypothetical protein
MVQGFRELPMILGLPMGFLMARCAQVDQILGCVTSVSASQPKVMDLQIFHPPEQLTTPSVSLQDFAAEPTISFRDKSQPGTLAPIHVQTP